MATTFVQYIGPFDAVELPLPEGGALTIERHGGVELDAEFASSLLEQADWQEIEPPADEDAAAGGDAEAPAARKRRRGA